MAKALILITIVAPAFFAAFTGCTGADETEAATLEMNRAEPVSEPTETEAEPDSTAEPAETRDDTADETAGETELVSIDAEELINDRCTYCHDVDVIYKAGHSRASWENTISRMVARGARLDETEREAVIKYLSDL